MTTIHMTLSKAALYNYTSTLHVWAGAAGPAAGESSAVSDEQQQAERKQVLRAVLASLASDAGMMPIPVPCRDVLFLSVFPLFKRNNSKKVKG